MPTKCWTGIEYAAAGAMIYEGLIDEARQIVRTARSRYDGRRRDGLDSGPGGNPFNELECGKFYARAMSSWSLLDRLARAWCSKGRKESSASNRIGSRRTIARSSPRRKAGGFSSRSEQARRADRRESKCGTASCESASWSLRCRKPPRQRRWSTVAGQPVAVSLNQHGDEVRLILKQEAIVPEAAAIEVNFRWPV